MTMGSIQRESDTKTDIEMIEINGKDTNTSDPIEEIHRNKPVENKEYEFQPVPTDGGYGWVIVVSTAVLSSIGGANVAAFGIFAVEYIEYFQASTASVAWIGSILLFMVAPAGFYTVPLLKIFGARKLAIMMSLLLAASSIMTAFAPNVHFLFFSYGIVTGGTYPSAITCGQVILQKFFHKKRARALSLALIGPACAMFAVPQLTRFLIDTYGWRGASLVFGGINLNAVVCGAVLRQPPMKRVPKGVKESGVGEEDDEESSRSCCGSFMDRYLTKILMFWGWYGIHAGHMLMVIYTPIRANVLQLDKTKAAVLLSTVGIVSGLVRLVAGFIGDMKRVKRNALAGAMGVYCGVLTVISASLHTFQGLIIYCAMFGIGGGFYIGLQGACVYDVVGLKKIAIGYMISSCAYGLTSLVTVSTAGYLYDLFGGPLGALLVFGTVQALGGACLCAIPIVQICQKRRRQSQEKTALKLENQNLSTLKEQSAKPFSRSVEHDLGQNF